MYKNCFRLFANTPKCSAEQLFAISMAISPLFLLTVAGWMTRILAVCALFAIYVLYKNRNQDKQNGLAVNSKTRRDIRLLCISLALPLLGTFLAQSFRGQYTWAYYDSPTHILICTLILLAILKNNTKTCGHIVEFMSYTLPIAALLALANILNHPNLHWAANRLSTQAVDPLAFGSLSLTLGLLSLISIKLHNKPSKLLILYKVLGFCVGIYLSIVSGSRTGWLALPIVGLIWIYFEHVKFTSATKMFAILGVLTIVSSSYFLSANVHQRIDASIQETLSYQWNAPKSSPNPDTSVGARISFARMAVFLLLQKPLSGWGDGSFESVINDPALDFAVMSTKMTALTAGFHNEITANMVRSGIWGLISSVALFLMPALFFIRNMRNKQAMQRDVAFMALAFLTCQFVSSLSMELLNLRYAASFYGLMIAIFCGQILFYSVNNTTDSNGKTR
jgi:O-antigen ligase